MDVGNLWLIHMDWVPGCAILNNINQTNHNKSLTNQILQGSQIKKTSSPFWPSNDSKKNKGHHITNPKNTLVSPENPSKVTIHLHQVWSLPKKVFHLMTQKVPFKNSPNGPRVQIVFHVWHIPTSHDLFFDLHIGQGSFLPFFAQETDGLPGRCKKGQKKRIYKIETYGCFLKWWYPPNHSFLWGFP